MHRLADIARIPADAAAIDRLQIILRKTGPKKRAAQTPVDLLHARFHVLRNLLRLFRRAERTAHAAEEQLLALGKQRAHGGALFLRLCAPAFFFHEVGRALIFQRGERFTGNVFSAEHQLSSSSKSITAAL